MIWRPLLAMDLLAAGRFMAGAGRSRWSPAQRESEEAAVQELMECLTVAADRMGADLIGGTAAAAAWKTLSQSRCFHGSVIEADHGNVPRHFLGFGCSVFVTAAFADAELAQPRPGLNGRLIASVAEGRPVLLGSQELRAANTRGGLHVVILYGNWRKTLAPEHIPEAQMLLAQSFFEQHVGYRISRILVETTGPDMRAYAEAATTFQLVADFERDRALWLVTWDYARSVPESVATLLFHPREPILKLPEGDQQLLILALRGLTDEEMSHLLGTPLASIKKRWLALFERASGIVPDLFPVEDVDRKSRGRQKRHRLLAYLRSHPEELRPRESDAQKR